MKLRVSPKRVLIDDFIFELATHGGVGNYVSMLIRELRRLDGLAEVVHPRSYSVNHDAQQAGLTKPVPLFGRLPTNIPGIYRLNRLLAHSLNNRISDVTDDSFDIEHLTFYTPIGLENFKSRARVLTVYDMIPEKTSSVDLSSSPWYQKSSLVHTVDAIICISEAAKNDLLSFFPELNTPIFVTRLGVDSANYRFRPIAPSPVMEIAYIGSRSAYKNFDTVLRALRRLPADVHLLCAGGGKFSRSERQRIRELGLSNKIHFMGTRNSDIRNTLERTSTYVSASRSEGFGLVTLEALASGTTPVLARNAAHLEVGGKFAHFFDADDDDMLAAALISLKRGGSHTHQAAAEGRIYAESHTWRQTAIETLAVYESVLS